MQPVSSSVAGLGYTTLSARTREVGYFYPGLRRLGAGLARGLRPESSELRVESRGGTWRRFAARFVALQRVHWLGQGFLFKTLAKPSGTPGELPAALPLGKFFP